MSEWTLKEKQQIEVMCKKFALLLKNTNCPVDVFASALMTTLARVVVLSLEKDEYIVDQFRKTLAANRQALCVESQKGGTA